MQAGSSGSSLPQEFRCDVYSIDAYFLLYCLKWKARDREIVGCIFKDLMRSKKGRSFFFLIKPVWGTPRHICINLRTHQREELTWGHSPFSAINRFPTKPRWLNGNNVNYAFPPTKIKGFTCFVRVRPWFFSRMFLIYFTKFDLQCLFVWLLFFAPKLFFLRSKISKQSQ